MPRLLVLPIVCGLAALLPASLSAQGAGPVPIERDLKREGSIDRRLGIDDRPPLPGNPSVSPSNPSGVAGFDGPPGTVGSSVGSYGPLPPGAPGNDQF